MLHGQIKSLVESLIADGCNFTVSKKETVYVYRLYLNGKSVGTVGGNSYNVMASLSGLLAKEGLRVLDDSLNVVIVRHDLGDVPIPLYDTVSRFIERNKV